MTNNSLRVLLALLALSLLGPASAIAAPRYERKGGKHEVQVKRRTPGRVLGAKLPQKTAPSRPKLSANDFIELQGKVKNITNATIQQYLQLIADTDPASKDMPDYLFRLAELYAQKQRYWRFRAMELYPQIDKASGARKQQLGKKQARYFKTEKETLLLSLAVYADLARNPRYKNYPRMDEVLFFYGYTLDGAKRIAESRKIFHQLLTNYPSSKYIPQAYLSFADYFFEKGDMDKAKEFYDKVLQFPSASIYPYALYKTGWVYLNLERPQEALETFFKTANLTADNPKARTINRAAKKDFVRAYAEVGRAERAMQSFTRVDKKFAFAMLQILGEIYLDQGMAKKAIYTFRELIKHKSRAPEVCEWQGKIVSAMLSTGSQAQKYEEIVNLVEVYLAHKAAKILRGSALDECRESAQGTSGEMARVWHSEAMKTGNFEALELVEKLYALYLRAFPSAPDHGELHYYYADLLWLRAEQENNARLASQRWEKTATEFGKVVQSGKLRGAKLVDAAHAAAQGWKNALDVDPRVKPALSAMPAEADAIPTPEAIGKREAKMLAAFDTYIQYATGDELVMMKFLRAQVYWRRNRLQEALPLFQEIVDKHPKHEVSLTASHILLDSLIRLQKFDAMNRLVQKMRKNTALLEESPELAGRLQELSTDYLRKKAEDLEKKGLFLACGRAYYRIFEQNQDADGIDEVLYNAGTCFEQGKSIGLAIRMFEILGKRHPRSSHNQKALVRMGSAYGAIAAYEKAAQKFEIYTKRYGLEADASDALQNAVTYRKGLGMDKEAIADIESFLKKYRKQMKEEAAAAMLGLAGIYENQGNRDLEAKVYKRYLSEIGKSGGSDRLLVAHAKLGELAWNASCKESEDGACIRTERERATRQASKQRRRLRGSTLPTQCGPPSKIKLAVLPRDSRRVAEANRYFAKALSLAQEGAIDNAPNAGRKAAAIYWMAASRFHMVGERYEKFLALEFPRGLSFSAHNPKKRADSEKRFATWLADKSRLAAEINSEYGAIKDIQGGGAAWAVAAAARSGQVSQNFSDGLFTAEIPIEVRTGPFAEEAVEVYCDTVTTAAEPLEEQSLQAFGFCLNLSTELNWFNRWSRLCEKELGQISPNNFPTATEFHGAPTASAAITDSQGLITKLGRQGPKRDPI